MHHVPLLGFTLALLATASAFVLPAGQADGLYKVRRTASGHEVHESVNTAQIRRSKSQAKRKLTKRDNWGQTYCGCGIVLNNGDTDAATADLKSQLGDAGSIIGPGLSYYSIRGGTVAFVCNTDTNAPLKAWSDIATQGFQQITDACGLYVAGSTGGNYDFSIGYMANSPGLDFCGAALSSPAGSC